MCFIGISDADKTDNLTCELFMIILHVNIIAFQTINSQHPETNFLMRLGSEWKYIGGHKRLHKNGKEADQAFKNAKTYYRCAIKLSKNNLGEHQLTSWCHKT